MIELNKFTDSQIYEIDISAAEEDCALRALQAAEFDKMLCGEAYDSNLAEAYAESLYE